VGYAVGILALLQGWLCSGVLCALQMGFSMSLLDFNSFFFGANLLPKAVFGVFLIFMARLWALMIRNDTV
jgi:hypothetical protein